MTLNYQMAGRGSISWKIKGSRPLYDICELLKAYLECKPSK